MNEIIRISFLALSFLEVVKVNSKKPMLLLVSLVLMEMSKGII